MAIIDSIAALLPRRANERDAAAQAQAVNLAFVVPVTCLVLLPIGLPLTLITWILLIPAIPWIILFADDPPARISAIAARPVELLVGAVAALARGRGDAGGGRDD